MLYRGLRIKRFQVRDLGMVCIIGAGFSTEICTVWILHERISVVMVPDLARVAEGKIKMMLGRRSYKYETQPISRLESADLYF